MKKSLDPRVGIAVIAVAVVVVILLAYRTYTGASAPAVQVSRKEVLRLMAEENQNRSKKSDAERKEVEEWKRTHPGAITRE